MLKLYQKIMNFVRVVFLGFLFQSAKQFKKIFFQNLKSNVRFWLKEKGLSEAPLYKHLRPNFETKKSKRSFLKPLTFLEHLVESILCLIEANCCKKPPRTN